MALAIQPGLRPMHEEQNAAEIIQELLDLLAGSRQSLARQAGVTYGSLYSWGVRRRLPNPQNALRLAEIAEERGQSIVELANRLRSVLEPGSRKPVPEEYLESHPDNV